MAMHGVYHVYSLFVRRTLIDNEAAKRHIYIHRFASFIYPHIYIYLYMICDDIRKRYVLYII